VSARHIHTASETLVKLKSVVISAGAMLVAACNLPQLPHGYRLILLAYGEVTSLNQA